MESLDFHKTKEGVVDVDFKAWDIQLHGLHDIQVNVIIASSSYIVTDAQVKNLHVLRHMGLQDLRLVIQVMWYFPINFLKAVFFIIKGGGRP